MKKVTFMVGTYYKNGQLKSEIKENNLINYYDNGGVKAKGPIDNEQMCGKWEFFSKAGYLIKIGHFDYDKQHGDSISYDKDGNVTAHIIFENGKKVETIK